MGGFDDASKAQPYTIADWIVNLNSVLTRLGAVPLATGSLILEVTLEKLAVHTILVRKKEHVQQCDS